MNRKDRETSRGEGVIIFAMKIFYLMTLKSF